MPLYKRKNIDWYRHLAFACVGGFFGAYAIMSRGGVMGSAQTVNLLGGGGGLLAGLLRGAGEPAGRLCPPRRGDDLRPPEHTHIGEVTPIAAQKRETASAVSLFV